MPRVTAILVARNGADYLERTLSALDTQTRRPDALVVVDAGSTDRTAKLLESARPAQFVVGTAKSSFGTSVGQAVSVAVPTTGTDDWIWLLRHDSAPHPRALAALLAAVEVAPSVAIAGPKLMRWSDRDTIERYGESLTRLGTSVLVVQNELDQAQYDSQSDLLGVSENGMLVRRSVWGALGGFDPGLPTLDAGLDFSVRARLAGHRVVGVPSARISSSGGPEFFGRTSVSSTALARARRAAQLHRRMVYAHAPALPFLWLSLLPLAIIRSLGRLAGKHPGAIPGEITTALATAFSSRIAPARRNLRRASAVGWGAISPLRMSAAAARERRVTRGANADSVATAPPRTRAGFISGGGAWAVLVAVVVGVVGFSPLIGAPALRGGALLPLSTTVGELWANVGYGWHDVGGGFIGASDPFAAVLAVLGSLTFWSPSLSLVLLYLVAIPVSALGAWWCATRVSERAWPPAIAALLWSVAPPLLDAMTAGRPAAVLTHVLLPWLVLAALLASRSWAAAATAGILFAAVAASSPSLVPALVVLLVLWIVARPTSVVRLIGILVPAAALFAPLIVAQFVRGTPLALLADPGVPVPSARPGWFDLVLGSPSGQGWIDGGIGIGPLSGAAVMGVLLLPFLAVALFGMFVPGTLRSVPSLVAGLLGFVTAVTVTHLSFGTTVSSSVGIYAGPGLSLAWFGLLGCLVVGLDFFRGRAAAPSLIVLAATVAAVAPLIAAPLAGTSIARASDGSLVPEYVQAEAIQKPGVGTLVITPSADGGIAARVERGTGDTLDDQSTLAATSSTLSPGQRRTATLAANLASRSGLDSAKELAAARIGFVVLADPAGPGEPTSDALDVSQRAADALDGNQVLTPVGDTEFGRLWRYADLPNSGLSSPTRDGGDLRPFVLIGLGIVFGITLLLAVPTARRRRRSRVSAGEGERATLGEDDDA